MTAPDLSFEEGVQVWYPEHNYYWLDASTFTINEPARTKAPAELLHALLRDDHYVNVYYTADDRPADRHDAIRASARGHSVKPASLTGYYNANASRGGYHQADTHGPYFLACVTPEAFEPISAQVGRSRLVEWLEDDGQFPFPPLGQVDARLARVLETTARADTIFWLSDLNEGARHDQWSLTDPFIELVAIDLTRETVTLVAAGGD